MVLLMQSSGWLKDEAVVSELRFWPLRFLLSPLIPVRETCVVPALFHDLCVKSLEQ